MTNVEHHASFTTISPTRPVSSPAPARLTFHEDEAKVEQVGRQLKALGHPTRLQLVCILAQRQGTICVAELVALLSITQPTVSHHLRLLVRAGIISARKHGLYSYYHVKPEALALLRHTLEAMEQEAESSQDIECEVTDKRKGILR